jgi:hypothetical protein
MILLNYQVIAIGVLTHELQPLDGRPDDLIADRYFSTF